MLVFLFIDCWGNFSLIYIFNIIFCKFISLFYCILLFNLLSYAGLSWWYFNNIFCWRCWWGSQKLGKSMLFWLLQFWLPLYISIWLKWYIECTSSLEMQNEFSVHGTTTPFHGLKLLLFSFPLALFCCMLPVEHISSSIWFCQYVKLLCHCRRLSSFSMTFNLDL